MKTIAFFDFDGTLYKKDSLLEFAKFSKGKIGFYFGILKLAPYLIAMKLNLISNEKAKQKFISYFYKNTDYEAFKEKASKFALTKIDVDIDSKIYSKFQYHLKNNHDVFIVTASMPEWIAPWSKQFNVSVIGTQLEIEENKITGNFISKNCFGQEKVTRIKQNVNLQEYNNVFVYGNGKGDFEMLQLSNKII
jgi:phosphatidylglycerophosphatase C